MNWLGIGVVISVDPQEMWFDLDFYRSITFFITIICIFFSDFYLIIVISDKM